MNLKGIYQNYPPHKQILLILILFFVSFSLCNAIGMLGLSLFDAPSLTDMQNKSTIQALKWLQAWSSLGVFIIPPFLFVYLTAKSFDFKVVSRQQLILSAVIMFIAFPLINALALWNESLHLPSFLAEVEQWMRQAERKAMAITNAFIEVDSLVGLLMNILIIAIIPALGEEILFRGLIQKELFKRSNKIHLSIWFTAFLFSAMHLQFLGFVPRFLIGGLLGYLFYWSGSIWLPIVAHFINNATAVILVYFIGQNRISPKIETLGTDDGQFSMLILSFFAISLLLYLLKSISASKKSA